MSMSPEVMQQKPYSYKADIWSVGVIFFALITGDVPFIGNDMKQLASKVEKG